MPKLVLVIVAAMTALGIFLYFGDSNEPVEFDSSEICINSAGDIYDLHAEPPNPSIYQDITFTANVKTCRPIREIIWNFGDNSSPTTGQSVFHLYQEGTDFTAPYRVSYTVFFDDNEEPQLIEIDRALEVRNQLLTGICPPNTAKSTELAQSILLESTSIAGCVEVTVPSHLIERKSEISNASQEIFFAFSWESLPTVGAFQAFLFINYIDEDGNHVDSAPLVSLMRNASGLYTSSTRIKPTENTQIRLKLMLNILNNPNGERVALNVGPFEIRKATRCSAADLVLRNEATNSEGSSNILISFRQGTPVEIIFRNTGCDKIEIVESSLIVRDSEGEIVAELQNLTETLSEGESTDWSWDQMNNDGEQVPQGIYTIILDTSLGEYIVETVILEPPNNSTSN